MVSVGIPSRLGDDARGVGLAAQQVPQALRGVGAAGKAASDADDGQRLVAAAFGAHGQLDCRTGEVATIQSPLTGLLACSLAVDRSQLVQ